MDDTEEDIQLRFRCVEIAISIASLQCSAVSMDVDTLDLAEKIRRFVEGEAGAGEQPQPDAKVTPDASS